MAITVPRLEGSVQQQGLPNPRISADAPLEAFGGGAPLGRAADAIDSAGRATYDFYKDQKKRADDIVVQDKLTALERKQVDTLHGEGGAYWQKGKNAFGLMESHYQPFEAYKQDLEKDLDPDQLYLFRKRAATIDSQTYEEIQKHIAIQSGEYADQSSKDYRTIQLDKGARLWNIPGSDLNALSEAERSLKGQQNRDGKSNDYVQTELLKFGNQLYRERIKSMLDTGEPEMAAQELERARADARTTKYIDEETYSDLDKLIRHELGNKKGRDLGESLFDKYPDPTDALAEARRIDDKPTRDAAVERVEELAKDAKAKKDTAEDATLQKLSNLIVTSKGTAELPRADLLRLTPEKQKSIVLFQKSMRSDEEPPANGQTYYDRKNEAAVLKNEFIKRDLLADSGKMTKSELHELIQKQTELRAGKDLPELDDFRTIKQMMDSAILGLGVDPNSKDPEEIDTVTRFRSEVAAQQRAIQERTGKKATHEQIQQIIDNLKLPVVQQRNGPFGFDFLRRDLNTTRFNLSPQDFEIGDVPKEIQDQARQYLRAQNLPVTDEAIIEQYIRLLKNQGALGAVRK